MAILANPMAEAAVHSCWFVSLYWPSVQRRGNRAVGVLEALSRTIYDPSVHLRDGETEPPADKTKQRLGRYVEDSLAGQDNEAIRGVANKVIELAHSVKHSTAPTRREAGIAADSVIMLANILRRVDQDF